VPPERLEAPLHQVGTLQLAELPPGVAQRTYEGLVRVLERSVRIRNQDQIAGLFGGRGEQPHARIGAPQLPSL
jgi:hypothetical protein